MNIDELVAKVALNVVSRDRSTPYVVLIAGGSCSGKTSLARRFVDSLSDGVVISMDDFYIGSREMELKGIRGNYDDIRAFDIPQITSVLRGLKFGCSVVKPVYNFEGHNVVDYEVVKPKTWIVFEGLYALHHWIREFGDVGVFVDCDNHTMLERRLRRDVAERGRLREDIESYFLNVVIPMYQKHVLPTRDSARFKINV